MFEAQEIEAMPLVKRTLIALEIPTFHRIPTKMPLQPVFMRGGAGHACMDDLVVDGRDCYVGSSMILDVASIHHARRRD